MIANFQEKTRLLADHLCPADAAIDGFLHDYLGADLVKKYSATARRWFRSGH
ncbi:MAG: hypothetical protein ACKO2G_02845 [Verrucomicrobiales bacterium]